MENFIVAIPSYQRVDKQETLEYFSSLGVPKERIYIFVQTSADREQYRRYESKANIVLAAADRVARARNNILQHFGGSTNILMLDDDISTISILRGGKLVPLKTREELASNINRCFAIAKKRGAELLGLYPVYNAFFMSRTISLKATVNTAIGFVKGSNLRFDESYQTKEDIELCARILSAGGNVIRYNFLTIKPRHRTNSGGCHEVWKSGVNKESAERLCKMYPDILAPHSTRADEVKLILKDDEKITL
jgi:hypothetical protein|nr:MAG TPA: hypothetical protein [Caudoviricetes sp.]